MQKDNTNTNLKWYAARAITDRPYVLKYLGCMGVKFSRIDDLPTLIFINCSARTIRSLQTELYDRVLFYKDPEKHSVQAIPERTMKSFLILAPFHSKPVIYLPVDNPAFFEGPLYRVTDGPFKGCEGVLKRLKGDKRLVIRISDHAAVATPHIPANNLTPVEGQL